MSFIFNQKILVTIKFVLTCPIRHFPHILGVITGRLTRSKPGFTFSDMFTLLGTTQCLHTSDRTTATQLRRGDGPECSGAAAAARVSTVDVVVMGRLPFSEGQIGQGLITVTESRDSYVRVYWCLISIRLYSVSCEPAILLHRAGICLTWKKS